ncbi:MAG: NUDIX domain-containing protein [Anaerolineales bacterium]
MPQRISAGGIVLQEDRILLVRHVEANGADYWVMPGGGIEGDEGIFKAAEREVWEETNLKVRAEKIAYVEDFIDNGKYVCKFWVYCTLLEGDPDIRNKGINENYLKDAGFFCREDIKEMEVFPAVLKNDFWIDLESGFPGIKYLGFTRF